MMHVRFKECMAWQSAQTILQIKWGSICNELHIDGTPHSSYLVRSRLCTQQYLMLINMERGETQQNYLSRQV